MTMRVSDWQRGVSFVAIALGIAGLSAAPAVASTSQPAPSSSAPAPDTTPPTSTRDTSPTTQSDDDQSSEQSVVVTGSRIASGFDRPTPVSVLGAARLDERGATNLGDALNELPQFRATNTPASTGLSAAGGYIGGRIMDLRGLGAERTLTLVDGKRFVPSTTQGTVDTNMIPSILLNRAEVVTGGASAIYGSDAVSGVVNLIIDKKFTGYKTDAQVGFSDYGDNFTRHFGAAGGWDIGSNLHLVVGGEWDKASGVEACYTRPWCVNGLIIYGRNPLDKSVDPKGTINGAPPTYPSSNILTDMYTWSASFNGVTTPPSSAYVGRNVPTLRPIDGITFSANGTPRRYQFGQLVNGYWQVGGENDGPGKNIYFDFPIVSPTSRYTAMGYLTWDPTSNLTVEFGVNYGHGEGYHRSVAYRNTAITIQNDNPFLPRSSDPSLDIPTILSNSGLTSFTLGKGFDDIGPAQNHVTNNVVRIVTSATYSFGKDWKADVYYQYGRNNFRFDIKNGTLTANILKALDATTDGNGNPVCRVNVDSNPNNNDPNCVPLDPFGYGNGSTFAAAKAYVTADGFQKNITTQNVVAANLTGSVFELPAGNLGVAVGAEYRSDSVNGTTDANSAAGNFFYNGGSLISGKIDVAEVYGETQIPILSRTPGFYELSVDGAVRRTHYKRSSAFFPSSSVGVTTWKIGGVWAPIRAVRLRVSQSRDIRAPNVTDLFGPQVHTQGILTDNGRGGLQTVAPITQGSNPDLLPEKADTFTAGVVLQPTGGILSRFHASVDYYDITIKDAISTLGQQSIIDLCAAGDAGRCAQVTRASDGTILEIRDTLQNVAQLTARGVDFDMAYRQPIGNASALNLQLYASRVIDLISSGVQRAGQTGLRAGTTPGMPNWTIDGNANLELGKRFSINTHMRWISQGFFYPGFVAEGDPGYDVYASNSVNTNTVPSRFYVDLLGTVKIHPRNSQEYQVYFGIDNLFNVDPPNFPGANASGNNILFNPVGRMFKFGVRANF